MGSHLGYGPDYNTDSNLNYNTDNNSNYNVDNNVDYNPNNNADNNPNNNADNNLNNNADNNPNNNAFNNPNQNQTLSLQFNPDLDRFKWIVMYYNSRLVFPTRGFMCIWSVPPDIYEPGVVGQISNWGAAGVFPGSIGGRHAWRVACP